MNDVQYMQDTLICIKIKRRFGFSKRIYLEMGGWYPIPDSKAVIYINSILMKNNMLQSIRINATIYNGGQSPMKGNYTYKQILAMLSYNPSKAIIDEEHCEFKKLAVYYYGQRSYILLREGYLVCISLSPANSNNIPSSFQTDHSLYDILYIGDDIENFTVPEDCIGMVLGDEDAARYKLAISKDGYLMSYNDKIPDNPPKIDFAIVGD